MLRMAEALLNGIYATELSVVYSIGLLQSISYLILGFHERQQGNEGLHPRKTIK